jgi:hypothetical protein
MQYILSEEEYRNLTSQAEKIESKKDLIISYLCRQVATLSPVSPGQGCIQDKAGYCNACPVNHICTYPSKEWAK